MSRSYTTRPRVTRTVGRGTKQQSVNNRMNPTLSNQSHQNTPIGGVDRQTGGTGPAAADSSEPQERKLEYQGGFSVLPPDAKKRTQIERQAQKEADDYTKYKERNRPQRVNYVGTIGGGEITENEARKQASQNQLNRRQIAEKSRQYRAETKRREEMEYQTKKTDARKKTEDNVRKEQQRQELLRQDHQRKNEAFLRRLEQK